MDLYLIVMATILLFPWSLVALSLAGVVVQRRRKARASGETCDKRSGAQASAGSV